MIGDSYTHSLTQECRYISTCSFLFKTKFTVFYLRDLTIGFPSHRKSWCLMIHILYSKIHKTCQSYNKDTSQQHYQEDIFLQFLLFSLVVFPLIELRERVGWMGEGHVDRDGTYNPGLCPKQKSDPGPLSVQNPTNQHTGQGSSSYTWRCISRERQMTVFENTSCCCIS